MAQAARTQVTVTPAAALDDQCPSRCSRWLLRVWCGPRHVSESSWEWRSTRPDDDVGALVSRDGWAGGTTPGLYPRQALATLEPAPTDVQAMVTCRGITGVARRCVRLGTQPTGDRVTAIEFELSGLPRRRAQRTRRPGGLLLHPRHVRSRPSERRPPIATKPAPAGWLVKSVGQVVAAIVGTPVIRWWRRGVNSAETIAVTPATIGIHP